MNYNIGDFYKTKISCKLWVLFSIEVNNLVTLKPVCVNDGPYNFSFIPGKTTELVFKKIFRPLYNCPEYLKND